MHVVKVQVEEECPQIHIEDDVVKEVHLVGRVDVVEHIIGQVMELVEVDLDVVGVENERLVGEECAESVGDDVDCASRYVETVVFDAFDGRVDHLEQTEVNDVQTVSFDLTDLKKPRTFLMENSE